MFNLVYLVQLVGIGIFGYIFGNMGNIVTKVDNVNMIKEEHEEALNIWLIKMQ